MNNSFQLLFDVLNSFLKEEKLNTKEIDEKTLEELFILSKKHDLAHIVSDVLYNAGMLDADSEIAKYFKQAQFNALYRYTHQEHACNRVYQLFEEEKISYIPLKGSVIRDYYKEPYMRTSGDIDILIEEKNLEKAKQLLCEKLGFLVRAENKFHDISLYTPEGVHIELHFNILENMENIDRMLDKVWDYTEDTKTARKDMIPEYFMFHHIAHMYYHFVKGGCGMRTLVDLYILKNNMQFDEKILAKMCKESGVFKFYNSMCDLLDIWFSDGKHDEITEVLEEYILSGGVYGSVENKTLMKEKTKGKFSYVISRIFVPYSSLKYAYPIIKKHKYLYPVMTVKRWTEILNPKRRKRAQEEFKALNSTDCTREQSIEKIIKFFEL